MIIKKLILKGDIHGNVDSLLSLLQEDNLKSDIENDTDSGIAILVLGDAGINFCFDQSDIDKKEALQEAAEKYLQQNEISVEWILLRGNHDCRPENIDTYELVHRYGGECYVENKYPSLLFLKDGEIYDFFKDKHFLALGGGYSKDFMPRLLNRWPLFVDQELSEDELKLGMQNLSNLREKRGRCIVLSHMLPTSVAQEIVGRLCDPCDSSTEKLLEKFLRGYKRQLSAWYGGHYHVDQILDMTDSEYKDLHFEALYLNYIVV